MNHPLYRLRWRFDFLGKPSKWGMWSNPGEQKDGAWQINKTGLTRASIESENVTTQEVDTVVECSGVDFVNFEWMAEAVVSLDARGDVLPIRTIIPGLALVTRDEVAMCFTDGNHRARPRTEAEKNINLAGFGH